MKLSVTGLYSVTPVCSPNGNKIEYVAGAVTTGKPLINKPVPFVIIIDDTEGVIFKLAEAGIVKLKFPNRILPFKTFNPVFAILLMLSA